MAEIAAALRRDIAVWDVVNEEIPRLRATRPSGTRCPDDYLAWCFPEAGRLFPREREAVDQRRHHEAHVTTAEYEAMIKGLQQRGVRVEGIGIQFHTGRGACSAERFSARQTCAVYERLGRLGLPLYITEITDPRRRRRWPRASRRRSWPIFTGFGSARR